MDGFAKVAAAVVDGKHSLGFLDMGGASAQIAFEPAENAARIHKHDLAKVTLRSLDGTDFSHSVFVATFLGHGTNEARRRYVDVLRDQAIANGGARDSRFPVADDPCLAVGLMLPTTDGQAALRGTGRFSECVAATEPLLNNTVCPIEPCLFAGVHAPEIDFGVQRFVGVSEYWYASHDYLGLGGMWDVEKFEEQASSFCQMPWSEAIQHLDGGGQNDLVAVARLQMQCFKAAWLVNVLHKGFGVPRGVSTAEISGKAGGAGYSAPFQSVNQVGDVEVSWTLGALLLKVSGTIPGKHGTLNDAKSRPGIVLPDNPGVNEGTVELEDGSLWSPLQFVGISRLLVLWSLQPAATRVLLALTVLGACLLVALLLYWLISATQLVGRCRHYHGQRQRKRPIGSGAPSPIGSGEALSPIPMESIGGSSIRRSQQQQLARQLLPPSPSQLGLAEAQSTTREYEVRRSPSMFVMDLFSGSPGAEQLSKSPSTRQMPPLLSPPPISRSSSVVNLTVSSRRRGV
ncbi:Golgi apyrase [Coemansia sp. RSA 2424]|nr:Golgi apyrase [Coemansia sp. RSA 2424]